MRVIIVNRALGIYFAGAERFDYEIALALQKNGVQVEIVAGKRLLSGPNNFVSGVSIHYLATPFLRDISQRIGGRLGNLVLRLDQFLFEFRCKRYLSAQKGCDIIQVCSLPHLVKLQRKMRVPVIIWFPGTPSVKDLSLIRESAAVMANGDAFHNIKNKFRQDVLCVPLGVNTDKFCRRPTDLKKRIGIGSGPVVLNVGRMAPVKNIPLLIKAFVLVRDKIPDARLLLVGTGPSGRQVERYIRSLNLSSVVHLAGFVDKDEVLAEYYSIADVFALSSAYDNDPNVIYEAMSCGLPIVATRVGGVPMQVKDGINGFLVGSEDGRGMAGRIVELLNNSRLMADMGRANRKAAESLSWDASAANVISLYQTIQRRAGNAQ